MGRYSEADAPQNWTNRLVGGIIFLLSHTHQPREKSSLAHFILPSPVVVAWLEEQETATVKSQAGVELRMSEVPIEELLERIQKHLDARKGASPKLETVRRGGFFSSAVYDQLEEAGAVTSSIYVKPFLTPPHLPVVGGVWQRMRSTAHELVVFYVNRLAGAQAAFNRQVVACLSTLVEDLDAGGRANQQSEIIALREEIKSLHVRLDALEAAAAQDGRK